MYIFVAVPCERERFAPIGTGFPGERDLYEYMFVPASREREMLLYILVPAYCGREMCTYLYRLLVRERFVHILVPDTRPLVRSSERV